MEIFDFYLVKSLFPTPVAHVNDLIPEHVCHNLKQCLISWLPYGEYDFYILFWSFNGFFFQGTPKSFFIYFFYWTSSTKNLIIRAPKINVCPKRFIRNCGWNKSKLTDGVVCFKTIRTIWILLLFQFSDFLLLTHGYSVGVTVSYSWN